MDPSGPGLQFHRIDGSRDANFWSVRASRDIRLIVHKTTASFLLAYVGHHDDAYGWAERRRIEAHPKTGAIQIVEVRERGEEIASPPAVQGVRNFGMPLQVPIATAAATTSVRLFDSLNRDDLFSVGVPEDCIAR